MTAKRSERVLLAHGGGGAAMKELVAAFIERIGGAPAGPLQDSAVLDLKGGRVAFTTDSFVVSPLFFPGGDIGRLAVCGTVNDLAVCGARPAVLSLSLIIEEGLAMETLERIAASIASASAEAGVRVVTGDTKVVERGKADGLFITTAGIGIVPAGVAVSTANARPGDAVIVNGPLAEHGLAILSTREGISFGSELASDTAPLSNLIVPLLAAVPSIRGMRDATRGGLAAVLNEIAVDSRVAVRIDEEAIPLTEAVRRGCELMGYDALAIANEGKFVAIVPREDADRTLSFMRGHPLGARAAVIGEIAESPAGRVVMRTVFGGERIVDVPYGDLLPRIC